MAITVFFDYVSWLYSAGAREYFRMWANFHWFLFHFFSVDILSRTLFLPWHRMRERGGRGLDIEGFLARLAVNIILRGVGVFVRASFIIVAAVAELVLFAAMLAGFIIFILSPLTVPILAMTGLILMFS